MIGLLFPSTYVIDSCKCFHWWHVVHYNSMYSDEQNYIQPLSIKFRDWFNISAWVNIGQFRGILFGRRLFTDSVSGLYGRRLYKRKKKVYPDGPEETDLSAKTEPNSEESLQGTWWVVVMYTTTQKRKSKKVKSMFKIGDSSERPYVIFSTSVEGLFYVPRRITTFEIMFVYY
jgi:hypothetical protein